MNKVPAVREQISDSELERILSHHVIWLSSSKAEGNRGVLNNKDLRGRELKQRDLRGIQLRDADLREAILSKSNLTGADLTGADLRWAKLDGTILTNAQLSNIDLRGTNIAVSVGVLPEQLGGSNLARATIPESFENFSHGVDQAATIATTAIVVFLGLVSACVFSWLIIGTTLDAHLLTNSKETEIPVINAKLPVVGFFWVAPAILATVYIYLHLYLQDLWEELSHLPAIFPDGRSLDEETYPWLLTSMVRRYVPKLRQPRRDREKALPHDEYTEPGSIRPAFSWLRICLSIAAGWLMVPITLFCFWYRYLPRHDSVGTIFHLAVILVAGIFGVAAFSHCRSSLELSLPARPSRPRKNPRWDSIFPLGVSSTLAISYLAIVGVSILTLWPPGFLFSTEKSTPEDCKTQFVERALPASVKDAISLNLQNVNFTMNRATNYRDWNLFLADAPGSVFVGMDLANVDFRNSILTGANFRNAKLQSAQFQCANLQEAKFLGGKLTSVQMASANLIGADFSKAVLTRAHFARASMTASNLTEVSAEKADFTAASLPRADLSNATLDGASFLDARLQQATLVNTSLRGADMSGADLKFAVLCGANLRDAVGLTQAQLDGALCDIYTRQRTGLNPSHCIANERTADAQQQCK